MFIRQLKQDQYDRLHKALIQRAYAEPLEACYTVTKIVDGLSYAVKIQPESRCRMAVLQAYQIFHDEDGQNFELITQSSVLAALFELILYQGL